MLVSLTASLQSWYFLFVMLLCKPEYSHTMKNLSFISFIHTDDKSPDNLEEICFDIDNNSVSILHFGVSLFIDEINSSCNSEKTELTEVRKYIINNDHQLPVCMTKLTVSMSTGECEKTIDDLKYVCQHPETTSIYFKECLVSSMPHGKDDRFIAGTILMSRFPKPIRGKQGKDYAFPRAHCIMKECKAEECPTNGTEKTTASFTDNTTKPMKSPRHNMILEIGIGCGGLFVGIVSTAIVFICYNRHRDSRIMNDDLISHRMTQTNRKFSIHSNGGETVYHDIADIPGPSKKDKIKGVSNVSCHYDSQEQRYSPSPKSSTSTYENESISSKKVMNSSKGSKSSDERPQVYHTLSKDYNTASANNEGETLLTKEPRDSDSAVEKCSTTGTPVMKHGGQYVTYEKPVSQSSSKKSNISQSVQKDDNEAIGKETSTDDEAISSNVYHVLQGNEDTNSGTLFAETTT